MSWIPRCGWKLLAGPALILSATVLATAPQLLHGNSCGHDFDFHLVSWLDAQNGWRQGIVYPHWAPSANFGAGEPRFVFYPPLTWMLGAAMGLILPWSMVPVALTFLLLAATGLATRALARQALDEGPATLAGCAALFSGYALFTAYERSAFGELTGGFWIPLLLLFILHDRNSHGSFPPRGIWRRALDGSAAPLALVVAGAWLSNAPVGVMGCYLLAGVSVCAALLQRSWAPMLRALTGAALGMGLAAIYLIPAAWEQRWIDIGQATGDPGEMVENSWLFARHANPLLALHDVELHRVSFIAATMIAVALGGAFILWWRGSLKAERRWWVPLALTPPVILFLQFPISLPVWNALPRLRFLQFPWRWLVAVEAPMAIFFALTIWPIGRWRRAAVVAACTMAFLAASLASGILFFQNCDDEDSVAGMLKVYWTGAGFPGADEYSPIGTDSSLLSSGLPAACLVSDPATMLGQGTEATTPVWNVAQRSCHATFSATGNLAEHPRIAGVIDQAGYLVLRLRKYPAWRVTVNGRLSVGLPQREDGLMAVPVPKGPVELTADWSTTPDVIAGRCLSGLALALITGLCVLERKLNSPRLS